MTSAINNMSVPEQRKYLAETRKKWLMQTMDNPMYITENLTNNMNIQEFALKYQKGQLEKRHKKMSELNNESVENLNMTKKQDAEHHQSESSFSDGDGDDGCESVSDDENLYESNNKRSISKVSNGVQPSFPCSTSMSSSSSSSSSPSQNLTTKSSTPISTSSRSYPSTLSSSSSSSQQQECVSNVTNVRKRGRPRKTVDPKPVKPSQKESNLLNYCK